MPSPIESLRKRRAIDAGCGVFILYSGYGSDGHALPTGAFMVAQAAWPVIA